MRTQIETAPGYRPSGKAEVKPKSAKTLKPSPAMLLVLLNLGAGREPNDHLYGRSQFGGYNGTRAALIARGWVDPYTMALTDAGRHVAGLDGAQENFECFTCIGCGATGVQSRTGRPRSYCDDCAPAVAQLIRPGRRAPVA